MIYAWGTSDPAAGQDITYHGAVNRGARSANLISSVKSSDPKPTDAEELSFTISNVLLMLYILNFRYVLD